MAERFTGRPTYRTLRRSGLPTESIPVYKISTVHKRSWERVSQPPMIGRTARFFKRHGIPFGICLSQWVVPMWAAGLCRAQALDLLLLYQFGKAARLAKKDPKYKAALEATYRTGGPEAVGVFVGGL